MQKILLLVVLVLSGCSSIAPPRPEYTSIPPLERNLSRIFITAGQIAGKDLKLRTNTGPVYINDQKVGSTAYKEYFAVDLLPGSYEIYWVPDEPFKFYSDKRVVTLEAGEVRYFTCDMGTKGIGWAFGLIGWTLSDYMWGGWLTENPSLDSESKLVAYFKLNDSSNSSSPTTHESVVNRPDPKATPANTAISKSVSMRLRELQVFRKDGIIMEDAFP